MNDLTTREPANDPQDLERLLVARENAGDVTGMTALFEPDAVVDIGGGTTNVAAIVNGSLIASRRIGTTVHTVVADGDTVVRYDGALHAIAFACASRTAVCGARLSCSQLRKESQFVLCSD